MWKCYIINTAGVCDLYNCARSLKESHGSRISFQLSCLFFFPILILTVKLLEMNTCWHVKGVFTYLSLWRILKRWFFVVVVVFVLFCFLFSFFHIIHWYSTMPGEKRALIKHASPIPLYLTPQKGQLHKAPLWRSTVH